MEGEAGKWANCPGKRTSSSKNQCWGCGDCSVEEQFLLLWGLGLCSALQYIPAQCCRACFSHILVHVNLSLDSSPLQRINGMLTLESNYCQELSFGGLELHLLPSHSKVLTSVWRNCPLSLPGGTSLGLSVICIHKLNGKCRKLQAKIDFVIWAVMVFRKRNRKNEMFPKLWKEQSMPR